jgi:nicotinamide-nucleotide amidase
MQVELISTGRELLSGRTVNRHAQTIGQWLEPFGLHLHTDTTVTDDLDRIADTFSAALERSDLIFITGGLGPTSDDITRDALARCLRCDIVKDGPTVDIIRDRYASRGRVLNQLGERQALVLDGAEVLPNRVGMAPGERLSRDGKTVFILPGPPSELKAVGEDHVLPWLAMTFPTAKPAYHRVFMTTGLGESEVITRLADAGFSEDGLSASYLAAMGRVEISLSTDENERALEAASKVVEQTLGDYMYAREKISLEEAVGRQLRARGDTLALAESCTGGLLGHRLTSVSGSSAYFSGGCITYSNQAKIDLLGVAEQDLAAQGAVSKAVAGQMAEGARDRFAADWGLSITGIAGPDGGSNEKPVGLVFIGLASSAGTEVVQNLFRGDRQAVKDRACLKALDLLRKTLKK